MNKYQIVEYAPPHMWPVIDIIGQGLREQKVIPKSDEPLDDADLYQIAETYHGRSRFWVYLVDEKAIGTVAILAMSQVTAQLKCMFVLTAYHGRGIGQQLLEHALEFAKSQHYQEVMLTTHPLMKRAHRFYERNGFTRMENDRHLYVYQMKL